MAKKIQQNKEMEKMSNNHSNRWRILIGAGCFADAQSALRLVDQISERTLVGLGGILVDELLAEELIGIPSAKCVTSGGTLSAVPTARQMRSLLESDAKAFCQTLSAMADANAAKWTFERRRGDMIRVLFEAASGWDMLLLGHRNLHKHGGDVVLIETRKRTSQAAEALAELLSRKQRRNLFRLVLSDPEEAQLMPRDTGHYKSAEVTSIDALIEYAGRLSASVIVFDLASGPLLTSSQFRSLLNAARCPILILGASQFRPAISHSSQIPPRLSD